MAKYDPLQAYLDDSRLISPLVFTFNQIEEIIADQLPPAAYTHLAWWTNNDQNHPHTAAWLAAGWERVQVDLQNQNVTFIRRH